MTDEKKRQLNEKLAKFAGLKNPKVENDIIVFTTVINEEEWNNVFVDCFTDSLDACFSELVPKAIQKMMGELTYDRRAAVKALFRKWLDNNPNGTKSFALALCLAIEKLIDKETK